MCIRDRGQGQGHAGAGRTETAGVAATAATTGAADVSADVVSAMVAATVAVSRVTQTLCFHWSFDRLVVALMQTQMVAKARKRSQTFVQCPSLL